jgi:hypothetical protein
MKTTTLPLRNLMNRSPLRAFVLTPFVLACFGFSPQARAVCQEGCSSSNTFLGADALLSTTGFNNTAVGYFALNQNTTGNHNTATGDSALLGNTIGNANTATGFEALFSNTAGYANTATGSGALQANTTGIANTATGNGALLNNTTANSNTAIGAGALLSNTTGQDNTAIGSNALLINTGSDNIALGFEAGGNLTTGSFNIDIGNPGIGRESGTIRLGRRQTHRATFIAGISGATVPTGVAVIVDADGHLGTTTSSARFKDAIKPMDKASEAILALKPVTFRYKPELAPDGIPQFGLVAEEVEKVNPDLVARDEQGKPYTVRYEAVNAMLLNEFLKEHGKVEKLEATVAQQQKQIAALTATVQKVSAQVEMSRHALQTVVDNH